ncbi:AbrB/MazE/SpoVT family DNA-binding domain-containing protein [Sphingomonas lacunae]|uniref:AbrB/MazE/SpoVT family DNA-binding domain-containing protein n=1 Tax=Sphingomonas lacunae TaxID=2698828 RepID=A0A6M4AV26_9SPHN|nr:AbrB/MazE/SpoVT family DNA-binding domain-containing protein [Sphingomonas lacunae]QJQ32998.1 AbrB/MazE/SpoVT family DNA-binding domain-containing protein [Sphingomonas lacunae]
MGKEYRAKVFKSGNSLALRLPKDLGLKEGSIMVLREQATGFVVEPEDRSQRKIDISGFAGKAPWLKPIPAELREFEERPTTVAAREAEAQKAKERRQP